MISFHKVRFLAGPFGAVVLGLGMAASAHADFRLVTSRTALGATDSIDWGRLGPESTTPANPSPVTSTGEISTVVSKTLPAPFARQNEGSLWTGNFALGDRLLWTNNFTSTTNNPITLRFGALGVFGGGAQIQADFAGDFVARITAFDAGGNLLATFTEAGTSNRTADNSAIFIGVLDTDPDIHSIALSLDSADGNTIGDFAINRFGLAAPIPEPGSLALLAFGVLGLLGYGWGCFGKQHRAYVSGPSKIPGVSRGICRFSWQMMPRSAMVLSRDPF
jgi:hypothetical protein